MTGEPLDKDSTPWTELFGHSDRVRVLEAVVELSEREVDAAFLASQLPMGESDIRPHLVTLADKGVIKKSDDGGYTYHNQNTVAQRLLELDNDLLTQWALQSDFDALAEGLIKE